MKNFGRNILFWLVAGTLMFMLLDNYSASSLKEELTYSEFKQEVKGKKVKGRVGPETPRHRAPVVSLFLVHTNSHRNS